MKQTRLVLAAILDASEAVTAEDVAAAQAKIAELPARKKAGKEAERRPERAEFDREFERYQRQQRLAENITKTLGEIGDSIAKRRRQEQARQDKNRRARIAQQQADSLAAIAAAQQQQADQAAQERNAAQQREAERVRQAQQQAEREAKQRAQEEEAERKRNATAARGCVDMEHVHEGRVLSFGALRDVKGPATVLLNQCGRPVSIVYCTGDSSCAPNSNAHLSSGEGHVLSNSQLLGGSMWACHTPYSPRRGNTVGTYHCE